MVNFGLGARMEVAFGFVVRTVTLSDGFSNKSFSTTLCPTRPVPPVTTKWKP